MVPRVSTVLLVAAWLWVSLSSARAQDVSGLGFGDIPFASEPAGVGLDLRVDAFWLSGSAERALATGMYELAYTLGVRAEALLPEGERDIDTSIVIIDALMAQLRWVEAQARIEALGEREDAPADRLALRSAMISYAEADAPRVVSRLSGVAVEDLTRGDAAWYWFLNGWARLARGDNAASRESFSLARSAALEQSPALAAQIGYLIFRSQLAARTAGAETVPQLQNALLENQGREVRFAYAQQLAVLLHDNGQTEEAIALVGRMLGSIPDELGRERAQFQLLATMAAGLERPEGRQAFAELIRANRFPELMSIALQHAFSRARMEEELGSEVLLGTLDSVVSRSEEHALLDQALYYRAVFKFSEGAFLEAEEDAARLLRRFPSSTYRRGILALQASSAWNRSRYRTAASHLQQMRNEFADLSADFRLSALVADCYLRAGLQSNTREDYRNAAEAYATALAEVTDVSQGGPLFFQLAMARIRAGQIDLALEGLDDPRLRALAGGEMVWRAEWIVLTEMRRVGRVSEAYDRAQDAILSSVSDPLLRLRMLWLASRLSVVSGEPDYTEDWVNMVEEFASSDAASSVDGELLNRVRASCLLSLAESHFAREQPERAVELLERLRTQFAGYEPALFSYIAQARYLSGINRTVEAQQLLVSLADEYRDHRLAPIALFEAALNAEQRGQDAYLDEATKLLQRIANDYPESEIVYRARLMQADLLRRLNKFGSAERIYEFLENEYAGRPDRFLAQMSLADTLLAQADQDPRKFDAAISRLELLMDLPQTLADAPLDLRMEAGYKLGQAWRTRGEQLKAKQIFWMLYDQMVAEELRLRSLTRKGTYWLARTLFALAELSKEEGDIDQANLFYRAIIEHRLNGAELARARLEVLDGRVAN